MKPMKRLLILLILFLLAIPCGHAGESAAKGGRLVYLVSDLRIPFWDIMWRGIESRAAELGYDAVAYSADNDARTELELAVRAINDEAVVGMIVSPTNSSACATILKLANRADLPVVISDIGTEGGEYVAYIASDNRAGAYVVGKILAARMDALGWQDGRVGIIAIPQKRANGRERTAGFMQAMNEAGIKGAGIRQQVSFSYRETYDFSRAFIEEQPGLRAIWLQGSDRYQAALDAIADTGRQGEILLVTFDAEPEFLQMIPAGELVGAGMQQPYLMGEKAVDAMHLHQQGLSVEREKRVPVLAVSAENIAEKLPLIRRNVLGLADGKAAE